MGQLRQIEALKRLALLARDGEIGGIEEVYFDDQSWTVRYLVVRAGGWLLGREVLVPPYLVAGVDEQAGCIVLDLTRRQVEQSPPAGSEKPVSRHYEAELNRYYGGAPYWVGGPLGMLGQAAPITTPLPGAAPPRPPEHPHLRASDAVRGYRIHARDCEFGEVEDFIVDDRDWRIRYVAVDTRRWLPGKKVLMATAWITRVDWAMHEIGVDLDSETIKSAPSYDAAQVIGREDEIRLYRHYGRAVPEAIER